MRFGFVAFQNGTNENYFKQRSRIWLISRKRWLEARRLCRGSRNCRWISDQRYDMTPYIHEY
ncbi:hypothetical protein E2C01_075697 [Portunus trituberculatus]|uniref:Uncharacterized protein n=1 Tax=Portunus trituberculatus TaxID=210409 RepID=A0A5B7IHR5_PORTR|nr:hypothetical protein [Portunus trituberculatus]